MEEHFRRNTMEASSGIKDMAVIVPDPKLMKVLKKIQYETGMEMSLHMGLFDDAVDVAHMLVEGGTRVIISRGETTTMIRNCNLNIPVLEIPITELDLTPLLVQARELTHRFAVVGFGQVVRAAQSIISVLGPEVEIFQISSVKAIPDVLAEVERRKFSVVVGNPQLVEMAQRKGMTGFPLTSREDTVLAVLTEAQKLVELSHRGATWQLRQQALLQAAKEKLFLLDAEGWVLNTNNPDGVPDFQNHPDLIDAVQANRAWSGLITDEGQTYLCKATPVSTGQQNLGAIILLENSAQVSIDTQRVNVRKGFVPRVSFADVLHSSSNMRLFIETAKRYSRSNAAVLIQGESGTGKEYIAQSIHSNSPRHLGPFVSVSCAAIPEDLLESELFGYKGGAFTGARKNGKTGLFELAHTGTIFLDEIGELPLGLQAKLLRVLEENSFLRIGGDSLVHVDVRVITATNKDLVAMVREKTFRDDLFFRLAVLRLNIPPLRERREDIELLFNHYIAQASRQNGLPPPQMPEKLQRLLSGYRFPGNVRELRSLAERLVVSCTGETITEERLLSLMDFPDMLEAAKGQPEAAKGRIHEEESLLIRKTLTECGNNKRLAAQILGISATTLWRKCRRLGLDKKVLQAEASHPARSIRQN